MAQEYDVLVVDDERVVVDSVKKVLLAEGLTVDEAMEAETALHKIEEACHRMAIVDLMMPRVSGTKLLQTIVNAYPRMPVVLTTGSATGENAVQILKLGAFDFLPKPFTMDELVSVVHRALRFVTLDDKNGEEARIRSAEARPRDPAAAGLYRLGYLSWVLVAGQAEVVTVGLEDLFQREIGPIDAIELPSINDTVQQGGPLARISAHDYLEHLALAPIGGKVVELNGAVVADPSIVGRDPYGSGWLLRVRPFDLEGELQSLVARPTANGHALAAE